jgi:hypothetical protein
MQTVQEFARRNGFAVQYTAWSSFRQESGSKFIDLEGTRKFAGGANDFFRSLPDGTEVYLIGHSFGGDSILRFLKQYHRTKVKIRLVAVLDAVTFGGFRPTGDTYSGLPQVEYFFNRWQTNAPFPNDIKTSGKLTCFARECDQQEQSISRHSDGRARKTRCGQLEACPGKRVIWEGIRTRIEPGEKQTRLHHQYVPTDPYIEQQLVNIIQRLIAPPPGLAFEARFRAVNDWAVKRGYKGAFPNFHQAEYRDGRGVVYGTILIKEGMADWKDIPAADLGHPRDAEARFRAVNDWAGQRGYAGAFPNFHQAEYRDGRGVVYGTILLKKGAADWKDIPAADLGHPRDAEARFRAVNDWAGQRGYASAFPNFHQAEYGDGRGVVYGTILLKKGAADGRDVPLRDLR